MTLTSFALRMAVTGMFTGILSMVGFMIMDDPDIRRRYPRWHKLVGAISWLCWVAAVSGVILAIWSS